MKTLMIAGPAFLMLTAGALAANHMTYGGGAPVAVEPVYGEAFTVDPAFTADGYVRYTDKLTANDLDGADLYSTISNEEIGEVEDVILENGNVVAYVLEVGGFLDIGDAEVTVPADQVMVMRQSGGTDTRVYINATEEQLESYPRYDYAD